MFKRFYPDELVDSVYVIDFNKLYNRGFRGILFDIDNTLVKHGEDATVRATNLIKDLRQAGYKVCLISNNNKERVERFNKNIQVDYIYNAHKPSTKNYLKAMKLMGTTSNNTLFVGDQLFTDVYGAKRAGMTTILSKPIDPKEEIQIVFKRYLERIVLYYFLKNRKDKKENLYEHIRGNDERNYSK